MIKLSLLYQNTELEHYGQNRAMGLISPKMSFRGLLSQISYTLENCVCLLACVRTDIFRLSRRCFQIHSTYCLLSSWLGCKPTFGLPDSRRHHWWFCLVFSNNHSFHFIKMGFHGIDNDTAPSRQEKQLGKNKPFWSKDYLIATNG